MSADLEPRIDALGARQLVGVRTRMSGARDRTAELWRRFMPRRREVTHAVGDALYSVEVYEPGYFDPYDPGAELEKWAAVEVAGDGVVPEGMEGLTLPGGLHAVFVHRGPASEAMRTYRYIHERWLPGSGYRLADRPHFAIMGEKYRGEDPASEEEIWIPIEPAGP